MSAHPPKNRRHLSPRMIALAVCLVMGAIIVLTLRTLVSTENRLHESELRVQVFGRASVMRARLEGELNSELLLNRGLVSEISRGSGISDKRFMEAAQDLMSVSKHIRNIGLAKGLVLTSVFPREGNEAAIGLVYNENPSQWPAVERAIAERKTIIAGPLELVQGGKAIIGRTPVFVPQDVEPAEQHYFGIVSTVINLTSLLSAAGIGQQADLRVALRGLDGTVEGGPVFLGDVDIFEDDPVLLDVTLPNGKWQMAVMPADGWAVAAPFVRLHQIIAAVCALFMTTAVILITMEFERRRKLEANQKQLIDELQTALGEVRTLSGLLPICSGCKKIRDDQGYWQQIEGYLNTHSGVQFSHGVCPDCISHLYPEFSEPDELSDARP